MSGLDEWHVMLRRLLPKHLYQNAPEILRSRKNAPSGWHNYEQEKNGVNIKLFQFSTAIIFLLSACVIPSGTSTPIAVINSTETPSLIPTNTKTVLPTATLTPSITPLPTIPTFTPTFDVRTIVTVTPAPKADCPKPGNPSKINFAVYPSRQKYVDHSTVDEILMFLNLGGQLNELNNELKQVVSLYMIEDVTNDGMSDLVIVSGSLFQTINILWCENGKYNLLPKDGAETETLGSEQVRFSIQDLNQNGIPDILSIGDGRGLNINILEWNGTKFQDLTADETGINAFMTYASRDDFELRDLNNDGITEFVLKGLPPRSQDEPGDPLRSYSDLYSWNGTRYSAITVFDSPQYRFQAIQDGDAQTLQGNYEQAVVLYKEAINSDNLDWWSQERFKQNREAVINAVTPAALTIDSTEYPRLAAYAYYRIMLLQLAQGNETGAQEAYKTLQNKFGNNENAKPYIDMASDVWNTYQSTHNMYDSCAIAIEYATKHPEILVPLGSDDHGDQSHTYVPADVCPFR